MSGSASGLFLCRGCRLHFMLRPVCLLPAARLSSSRRLLTSRLGHVDFSPCLGPAIRRLSAYRFGTFTLWRNAASEVDERLLCITTHHRKSLADNRCADRRSAPTLRSNGRVALSRTNAVARRGPTPPSSRRGAQRERAPQRNGAHREGARGTLA